MPGAEEEYAPYGPSAEPARVREAAMKGDRVEIVIDAGGRGTKTYEITATRRGVVEVNEVTRSGVVVRTARFMSSRVVALVEHPAPRRPEPFRLRASGNGSPD